MPPFSLWQLESAPPNLRVFSLSSSGGEGWGEEALQMMRIGLNPQWLHTVVARRGVAKANF